MRKFLLITGFIAGCGGGGATSPPDAARSSGVSATTGCAAAVGAITYQQLILASRNVNVKGNFTNGGVNDCPALKPADLAGLDAACAPVVNVAECKAPVACDISPRTGTTQTWSAAYTLRGSSLLGSLTLNQVSTTATMTCVYDVIGRFAGM